jgi:hypothetical protein
MILHHVGGPETVQTNRATSLGPPGVTVLPQGSGGFVALTQQRRSGELEVLEESSVRAFDIFRAPLSDAELSKRSPATLSERRLTNLLELGYPYVGQDFRFHMTLTGRLDEPAAAADALADVYASEVGGTHFMIEAVVLFEQLEPDRPFRVANRFPLTGT